MIIKGLYWGYDKAPCASHPNKDEVGAVLAARYAPDKGLEESLELLLRVTKAPLQLFLRVTQPVFEAVCLPQNNNLSIHPETQWEPTHPIPLLVHISVHHTHTSDSEQGKKAGHKVRPE